MRRLKMTVPVSRRCFCLISSLFLLLLIPISAAAQQDDVPKNIADSVGGALHWTEGQFLGVAEAMPESKYDFVPSAGEFKGVRSFAEQVKHVACSNFAFFNEIEGKTPPEHVDGPYAGPNTRLGIAVAAVWHIADHYGQIVEYLRMNGIVPPSTQKYGLAVR